ncbi:phosphoenolpyruvate--protein phosphotransferase [Undibacterium sp. RTI2.1]|uniref:phosphoenolpyruvate--protein phosphotransferase n=1 Tax=unclassified Undibacterium TaxID=2630295 RepID=UPI002AB5B77C|nr:MULTISPECIES: phosphoenolpyruvate--protein phosphotransferase [unclassified Undibacterium]MDY7539927.1 phosphoenolpyruvate--protein phosphotransferase [Undibacterium sp. 5I1]MEB0031162.1 phosphoenolpyruvate--protein phosphotransferase [Undibacterium sp. RTI2.1]MEB0116438.1 phosphoenolpyruvate--protein phosphotransferase [Undibacterium sp. RTI2.2]MEB0230534.1 phosphoenolpyruvate--protein phosphotransferase [Undibacterium sp. 10I3]MEB0257232.1 phosphoenolpyruvate--protein phosphotransferase [
MASFTLQGIPVSRGIAIGRAHLMRPAALDVEHYLVAQEQIESEVLRLQDAIVQVHKELQTIWADLPLDAPTELGAFLDVHALILSDPMISEAPLEIIRTRNYNAEWALVTQIDALSAQFDEIEDDYLRERKADIQQVAERVLKVLTGSANDLPRDANVNERRGNMIVVARDISPADMMQFRDAAFSGFVTDEGGQNSHTAIVSRSLGIPAVVGLGNASHLIQQDDWLIIDSDAGVVIVAPSAQVIEEYRNLLAVLLKTRKKLTRLKKTPAITQDGIEITLLANIELPQDAITAMEAGASGVGLFRSEFLFMGRTGHEQELPTEEEQFVAYRDAVLAMKGKPVTIRTLDVGADKPLDTTDHNILNPALGLRAIRYCLAEPQLFLTQLRAILRASAFGPVHILIPMMAHAFEIDQSLAMIEQAKKSLLAEDKKFDDKVPVGAMIEVPAAALSLPMFVKKLDFLSVGTNDLIQYTLAIDRADHEVAHLYSDIHPAILQLLAMTVSAAQKAEIPVAICGGMAGDIRLTRLLIGMGFRELSMPPALLPEIKQEILNTNIESLQSLVKKILRSYDPDVIQESLAQLAIA